MDRSDCSVRSLHKFQNSVFILNIFQMCILCCVLSNFKQDLEMDLDG